MPIYEFECRKCGRKFETLMKIGREEIPPCPECGSARTERLVSVFGSGSSKGSISCDPRGST